MNDLTGQFHESDDLSADGLPNLCDEHIALIFAERHAADFRHVDAWGRWLSWTEMCWRRHEQTRVFTMIRSICREIAKDEKQKERDRRVAANGATVARVERLLRYDPRLIASADQWDADPMLLNTPGGTVDLRTGEMREHRRDDYITKITAATPGGDCPRWHAFLDRMTGGDPELQGFIQRFFGYGLSGDTSEHCLVFFHGGGGNGKTTLFNTIAGLFGDYHRSAPMETFIETRGEQHPTNVAELMGARLVTAVETEEGRRWAAAKIKTLTGGDRISARFMRQDFFEFVPAFKLAFMGNKKPGLRSVDEAIRRRFLLFPCGATIPDAEQDKHFGKKLKREWGGILAWLVAGCLDWQHHGLRPPAAVLDATAEYLAVEDVFTAWMDETIERRSDGSSETTASLFQSWREWAEQSNEQAGSQKRFSKTMQSHGFVGTDIGHEKRRGFKGVRFQEGKRPSTDIFGRPK